MKILLVGEYSRLHNSLKEGLIKLGHHIILMSSGDDFKQYPTDININASFFKSQNKIIFFFRKACIKLFKIDPIQIEYYIKFWIYKKYATGFDIVQLINENSLKTIPFLEKKAVKFLANNNKKLFLLSCGEDFINIDYHQKKFLKYSILTPYFAGKASKKSLHYSLKYVSKPYQKLHQYIYSIMQGVIATDLDYHIPLKDHPKYLGMIPNPINIDTIRHSPLSLNGKITIFYGENKLSSIKKGGDIIREALTIIKENYRDKVEVKIVSNVPYTEYINIYKRFHILMDQVYSYDQGYNALEAMAQGKVVFTGAEQEWLDYYVLKEDTVAINALSDAKKIAVKLEWLILNPEKILEISENARQFIVKEHDYISIAKQYLKKWSAIS